MTVSLVKVVSGVDGWSSDCGRHIRRFAPYIFQTVCSLGGGLLVGVSLVKVVSLLDGWSSDSGRHIRRFAPYIFQAVCFLGGGLLVGVSLVKGCRPTRRVEL